MTIERQLIQGAAAALRTQIVEQVVKGLQELPEGLSGGDSGLANVWEEICAQAQTEHSLSWATYLQTVEALIDGCVDELPLALRRILSVTTDAGDDWLDGPDATGVVPIFTSDIVEMLSDEVLTLASNFGNSSIERFRARRYEMD